VSATTSSSAGAQPGPARRYLLDPAERATSTFVQQFSVILLASGSAGVSEAVQWSKAADVAGFAAVVSLLTSLLTFRIPPQGSGPDLLLRVLKTGLQSFLGVLAADQLSPGIVHADWGDALAAAVPVMLLALLKGTAALAAPWSEGASLLPAPAASEAVASEAVASEAVASGAGAPGAAASEAGVPETAASEAGVPEAGVPEAGDPVPEPRSGGH
jgi:Putative lactococcus lactis phage r1t holin